MVPNSIAICNCMMSVTYLTTQKQDDKFLSGISLFYGISGAPNIGIKRPGARKFIQSKSQGSRFLKPGAVVLYKVRFCVLIS